MQLPNKEIIYKDIKEFYKDIIARWEYSEESLINSKGIEERSYFKGRTEAFDEVIRVLEYRFNLEKKEESPHGI